VNAPITNATVENMPISAAGNDAPIGIFDSGVGGLTVARAIIDQLPGERVRYVGDTANGPYGPVQGALGVSESVQRWRERVSNPL